jgi:hypothetical protein
VRPSRGRRAAEHHTETTVEDLKTGSRRMGRVTLRITAVTYHTSTGVPAEELADRCHRTLTGRS